MRSTRVGNGFINVMTCLADGKGSSGSFVGSAYLPIGPGRCL